MNYPLLSEYVESIRSAEDNLAELNYLHPVLDANGDPVMTGGNFAVVFKMQDKNTGKYYALKCFTREQEGRAESYKLIAEELEFVNTTYFTHFKYFDKELFVDCANSDETEFPVVLMDWVEGITLDKYIREHIDNQYELSLFAYQFSQLAMWLMPQPFAHGDLKPDNILVQGDGTIVLVDYDGMYVPAMKGQKAREFGSPGFRHPSRTIEEFNEHIDDFPIASILLSLKAIALQPSLLDEYGASDRLLLSENDYRNISRSRFFKQVFPSEDTELNKLMNLFMLALSENDLSSVSTSLFNLQKPVTKYYNTEVTEEDIANGIEDEYGVVYSKDGKRLLKANKDVFKTVNVEERGSYFIKGGTKIICDNAFEGTLNNGIYGDPYLPGIMVFPESVIAIGNKAFAGCEIYKFEISKNLLYIGDYAFEDCSIREFTIPSRVSHLGKNPFIRCSCTINSESKGFVFRDNGLYTSDFKKLICCKITNNIERIDDETTHIHYESVSIVNGVQIIGASAFERCYIWQVVLPPSIKIIEEGAFANTALYEINIPSGVTTIEDNTFWYCTSLTDITLPKTLKKIGNQSFGNCSSLTQINIPSEVMSIGDSAFVECQRLKRLIIPKTVSHIGSGAFNGCDGCSIVSLSPYYIIRDNALYTNDIHKLISCFTNNKEFVIPDGVQIIGKSAFEYEYLNRIEIPDSVVSIEELAMTCRCLRKIIIPGNVKSIKDRAFWFSDLKEVSILEGVETIGNEVFYECSNLKKIKLPLSLKKIGEGVFTGCYELAAINIPVGTSDKFEKLLPGSRYILVEQENGWQVKSTRPFSSDEIAAVARAEVVSSQFGNSVCFFMNGGGKTYIPLCVNSTLTVGDELDLRTAKILTLSKIGEDDIIRIIE